MYKELAPFVEEAMYDLLDSGLGDAFLFARKGTQAQKMRILLVLLQEVEPLSALEIHRRLIKNGGDSIELGEVRIEAEMLVLSGVLNRTNGGCFFIRDETKLEPGSLEDRMELVQAFMKGVSEAIVMSLQKSAKARIGIFQVGGISRSIK